MEMTYRVLSAAVAMKKPKSPKNQAIIMIFPKVCFATV